MKKAFIFPGQGSQTIGMAKEFYDNFTIAKDTFLEVDEALKQNLSHLIFNGPITELTYTANAQPAIMVASIAILRCFLKEKGLTINQACALVAGHSLGEYTALCAANAITLSDTAKLLRVRGDAMQNAIAPGQGTMAAVLGMEIKLVEELLLDTLSEGEVCQIANDNCPGQIVISGNVESVNQICEKINQAGFKTIKLPVSSAFHCSLMKNVEPVMFSALSQVPFKNLTVPLIANFTALEITKSSELTNILLKQICGRVKWRESVIKMKELGVTEIVEFGATKVLNNLNKRTDSSLTLTNISSVQDINL